MTARLLFEIEAGVGPGRARAGRLVTAHGQVLTPVFMPVGTQGSVKGLAPREVLEVGSQIILANTYHLHLRPGEETVSLAGGLHSFMAWPGPILTDSGGYQVFSLSGLRKVSDEGVRFRSHIDGSERFLSPEKVIDIQLALGSDLMMVLDECPSSEADRESIVRAVRRTLNWAGRSRARIDQVADDGTLRPGRGFFGIVQGGVFPDLRRDCAAALVDLGFDGYAIGGLGLGEAREDMLEAAAVTAAGLPADRPRYFMGLGTPSEILTAVGIGVDMFDCVLPTRLGRHGTVMTRRGNIVVRNARYSRDFRPLEAGCECYACRHFTRAYVRHLIAAGEILGLLLCAHHNLHFLHRLMRETRRAILDQRFAEWSAEVIAEMGVSGTRSADEAQSGAGEMTAPLV
jgi:queuine tRNA-ribosyltransferase